jgi:hypothetical protein
VTYLVLGATHPHVVKHEGESYRLELQRRVRELGLEENVLFHPRFVELHELLEYLGAADICVTPYLNLEQITSGALSYAMGSGKAVVSTPYWHAEELLAEGRGCLAPIRDSKALVKEINALLDDEVVLSSVRKKAYMHTRPMVWEKVAGDYVHLFEEVRSHVPKSVPTASSLRRPLSPTNLPTPRLDHVLRLCDDTGPAHHARYTVPEWNYGYHLGDAASTLVAGTKYYNNFGDNEAAHIADVCLGLIQNLLAGGDEPADRLSYDRKRGEKASDASIARALWAVGYVVSSRLLHRAAANDLFQEITSSWKPTTFAGRGYGILGTANYLMRFPGASDVRRILTRAAEEIAADCGDEGWMDRWEAPDWPVAVQAAIIAAQALENPDMAALGKQMMNQMFQETKEGTVFLRRGDNTDEEELPLTAAAFIEAAGAAYKIERSEKLLLLLRSAADWFLGANGKSTAVYDFETCGCYDALTASGLNRNQGMEATTFCLLAFLTLTRITGIGMPLQKDVK